MKMLVMFGLACACVTVAACNGNSDNNNMVITSGSTDLENGHILLDHDGVTLRPNDAPNAIISANGDLSVDQKPVAINDAQRQLLKAYYQNVYAIREDGIATGKAGAAVGLEAVKSVATRLASGDPDKIQKDVDAKANLVKQSAAKICQDIGGIQTTQNQLATQLPAFKPYANIVSGHDTQDCMKDAND